MNDPWADLNKGISEALNRMAPIMATIEKAVQSSLPSLRSISIIVIRCETLEKNGWLPHYTMPFEALDSARDNTSDYIEAFYSENWHQLSREWLEKVQTYSVDQEAKDVFAEAIFAHGQGLYRASIRMLFPEIERISRLEFSENAPIKTLKENAGTLTSSEIEPVGYYGLKLYMKLMDHLYRKVKTPEELAAAQSDSVPNRHAVAHGLINYSTSKNSLNTLIMTDYVLQIINAVKRRG